MKKFSKLAGVLALAICAAMTFSACQSGTQGTTPSDTSSPTNTPSEAGAKSVAFFIAHKNNAFMVNLSDAVEKAAKDKGLEIKVYSADSDPAKQVSQIESAIAQGVDGLLIDPASFDGITTAIEEAKAKNIPVVTLHERVSIQDKCDAFVGVDLKVGGKAKMEQVLKDFGDSAEKNIAFVYGVMGDTAQIDITAGYDEALGDTKINKVFEGSGKWTQEGALDLVSNWLSTGKQIDAIVCNNDAMALGALQAVKSAGKEGKIRIYGLDAVPEVIKEVSGGNISATIYNDFSAEADKGTDVLIQVMGGESFEKETVIPPIVITKDNANEYLS